MKATSIIATAVVIVFALLQISIAQSVGTALQPKDAYSLLKKIAKVILKTKKKGVVSPLV